MLRTAYDFVGIHRAGFSGQTYKLKGRVDQAIYCLKTVKEGFSDPKRVKVTLQKEVAILRPLQHNCLPRVFQHNFTTDPPFYVCSFHPGKTFVEFRDSSSALNFGEATSVTLSLIDTLEYLHAHGRTHCDLHQENILIGPNIFANGLMIIDLGSGHRLSASEPKTKERGHLALKLFEDIPRFRDDVERHLMGDSWRATDFKAIGALLLLMRKAFFGKANADQRSELTAFCKDLLSERITDWSTVRQRFEFVIDPNLFITRSERYLTMSDSSKAYVRLPACDSVRVGDAALAVINTPTFQRLRGIKQLSFCEWYFPGAVHTRFEHSLGVFGLAQKAIAHLCKQEEVKARYTQLNVDGALLAALVHDIGHYPLAHVIEHYISARFPEDKELRTEIHHSNHSLYLLNP